MPQTVGAGNTVNATADVSTNGTSWTDVSGSMVGITAPTQTADTGEIATLAGQYKIATAGKLNPVDITVRVAYTEKSAELWRFLETQAAVAGRPVYLRWSSFGGGAGTFRYVTADGNGQQAAGTLTSFSYPGADANEAAATVLEFTIRATRIARQNIGSPSTSASPSASTSPSASV